MTDSPTAGAPAAGIPTVGVAALRELRATRRKHRIEELDWFEAAYRAYLTAILGIVITLFLSSWLGDDPVDASTMVDVRSYGPAAVGVAVALAFGLGLRSGSRGGPLALEAADVRYVLLGPLPRRDVLLGSAWRSLRHTAFLGAVVGAIAGQLAGRRLGGSLWAWAASGAATGALIGMLFTGAAMVACGIHLPRWVATLAAAASLVWAVLDVTRVVPSPFTTVGSLAFWPLRIEWVDLAGAVAVVAIAGAGLVLVARLALEEAERRTALVGQLRFAVTLQDLRTVLILRRQLAQDLPRGRPWIHLGSARRFPVWRRDWHGVLRFPASRLVRLALLAVAGGLCLRFAFEGIPPLIIVSGLAFFLAGLEAAEPLAQDVDQAERTESLPRPKGDLYLRHLPVTAAIMVVLGLIAGLVFWAIDPSNLTAELALIVALPAALCGGAGGVVSVVMGAPEPSKDGQLLPPEVAGMKIFLRSALPIIVSIIGSVPALVAHRAEENRIDTGTGAGPVPAALSAAMVALLVAAFVAAYVRYQEQARAWWRATLEESTKASKERQATRNP